MEKTQITISVTIKADKAKIWEYYTHPNHIVNWNFATSDWQCPSASNDLRIGGKYCARMEAKDGSFGFDFEATYSEINVGDSFIYLMQITEKFMFRLKMLRVTHKLRLYLMLKQKIQLICNVQVGKLF